MEAHPREAIVAALASFANRSSAERVNVSTTSCVTAEQTITHTSTEGDVNCSGDESEFVVWKKGGVVSGQVEAGGS